MKLILRGELTDLNSYIKALNNNRYAGSKIKKQETERVYWECKQQKIKPITKFPVKIHYKWYSPNERKDTDNVAFAKKFCADGLVMAGVLPNDSRKYVNGFSDDFFIDKNNSRIEIEITT